MKKLVIKVLIFLAYCPFAGYSAWMTAISLHLNNLSAMPFWLVCISVFLLSLLAGYYLNKAIREPMKQSPSYFKFGFCSIIFLGFWGVSFMTNVHYNYVLSYGYDNLSAQVQSCINYLNTNINKNDAAFDTQKDEAKRKLHQRIDGELDKFQNRLNDTRPGYEGFGQDCISILNGIEGIFESDSKIYGDNYDYSHIFDDVSDIGDKGKNIYKNKSELQSKYSKRIKDCLDKRYEVIDHYYDSQKSKNGELKEVLALATDIEKKGLPQIEGKKNFESYSECYTKDIIKLLKKMPLDYKDTIIKTKKNAEGADVFDGYLVYPSERMFNWLTVWEDWWDDNLPENDNFKSGMPTAFIWDVVAFILISML